MNKHETEIIEFKKSTSELKQGVISLSSMLNKHGTGELYFGVLNNGEIVGQQVGEKTTHDVSVEIKNHIKPTVIPTIELLNEKGKDYIKVTVNGNSKPYSAYGRYYIRSDDEDIVMDNDSLYAIFNDSNLDYSDWENAITEYAVDDVDEERLISYFNDANSCGRIKYVYKDPEDALSKLSLLKKGKLNNAGYYLFSKNKPLKLKLAVFNTEERISFSYINMFEGNIFDCIDASIQFISRYMNWSAEIVGTKRLETPEIPLEAIREIVVNSFAHMKYRDSKAIVNSIYFTPGKLKITNAGGLPANTTPEDYALGRKGPVLRNPLIDMVLYKNNMIDSFATGFERTFRLCKENGIEYEYSDEGVEFSFTFIRSKVNSNDTINDTKTNRKDSILSIIRKDSSSTRESIAQQLNLSTATIGRELRTMQELGLIKRKGSNKNGYWIILDDSENYSNI
ncbi:MAG: putative DNA binding domain-containing protein [Erysipelotrichaceae bacterium]|nr:putative DNA binding domain-containing protein [Erysipelotrichaceae bacterium]